MFFGMVRYRGNFLPGGTASLKRVAMPAMSLEISRNPPHARCGEKERWRWNRIAPGDLMSHRMAGRSGVRCRRIKGAPMPLYTFELSDGSAPLYDDAGVHLPDREHALAYGEEVARELMRGCEAQTRFWRLRINEKDGEEVFEMTFATVDPTLDHLVPELRTTVQRVCDSYRSCKEAVHAAGITMRESRALVARSRGKPYLATVAGDRTIK